ncbi:MAG: hypothetical protein BWY82_01352 [Verrucomicrobia bacterium ADurb.Bin474]|nr:MAG: hypothetical protein BWY82_01352 [Verrucomicrobia bacterium ADurb.Bin474]
MNSLPGLRSQRKWMKRPALRILSNMEMLVQERDCIRMCTPTPGILLRIPVQDCLLSFRKRSRLLLKAASPVARR